MKLRKHINLLLVGLMLSGVCMNALAVVNCTTPQDLNAVVITKNVDFETMIKPIINNNCTGCHTNGGGFGGLAMGTDAAAAYTALVNVMAVNANAAIPRVTPNNEELSFLFKKINCTDLNTMVYGNRMPLGGTLSDVDQALILDWIQQGAKAAKVPDNDYLFFSGFGRN